MNQEVIRVIEQMNEQYGSLQEQLKIVEQQIVELGQFKEQIFAMQENKDGTVITSIGKSVFAPAKFLSSEKMFVEIGAGYFVRKTINETVVVIEEQAKRLHEFKAHLSSEFNSLTAQLEMLVKEQRV